MNKYASLAIILFIVGCSFQVWAQPTDTINAGFLPYQSYSGGNIDSVNLGTGTLTLRIPLVDLPQRGTLKLNYSILYNSKGVTKQRICDDTGCVTEWDDSGTGISPYVDVEQRAYATYKLYQPVKNGNVLTYYYVKTPDGGVHAMANVGTNLYRTIDATGMLYNSQTNLLLTREGNSIGWTGGGYPLIQDPNGNTITYSSSNITDSIGRAAPTVPPVPTGTTSTSGCPAGPLVNISSTSMTFPGASAAYVFCYATSPMNIPDGTGGATWGASGGTVLQSVVLPNGTYWQFEYNDLDATNHSINYGSLTKIKLPTGGAISYTYISSSTVKCRLVASRTVTEPYTGSPSQTWNYVYILGTTNQTKVTDAEGNYTVHTFGLDGTYEVEADSYDKNSNLLRTEKTDYSYNQDQTYSRAGIGSAFTDLVSIRKTVIWHNGQQSKVEKSYDQTFTHDTYYTGTLGFITEERDYDYGSGAPGALLRRIDTSYLFSINANYKNANIVSIPSSVVTYDGAGNTMASTSYSYDETAYSPQGGTRGNRTTTSRWLNTDTTHPPTTHTFFDAHGMPTQQKDANGNVTTTVYDSTGLFAQQVQHPGAAGSESFVWNANTSTLTSHTDANGQVTTYDYDLLNRPTQVVRPDSGTTTYCYTDEGSVKGYQNCAQSGPPFSMVTATQISSSVGSAVSTTRFDGLGRLYQTQLTDPEGDDLADIWYDDLGRAYKKSNPHRSASAPTDGTVQNAYDALGRITSITEQDGSVITIDYSGFPLCITQTDEAGHARKNCSDGLGRITKVFEDPSGLGYETDYTYDALGNLLTVNQKGSDSTKARARQFTYDSLSRLTVSNNPETGAINYSYDPNGNITLKQDSRVATSFCYEQNDRIVGKKYASSVSCSSPSTWDVTFTYDVMNGLSNTFPIGRLTGMADSSGTTAWAYDRMGRVSQIHGTIDGVTKDAYYGYLLNDAVDTITYPSGRVIQYGYSTAARATQANWVVNGVSNTNYVNSATHAPSGQVAGYLSSVSSGFSGIQTTASFNSRLQPATFSAYTPGYVPYNVAAQTIYSLSYNFNAGHDNGNIVGVVDNLDSLNIPGRPIGTVNYTYDNLNRILTAQTTGTDCTTTPSSQTMNWGEQFTVDAWGNLTNVAVTRCSAMSLNQTVTTGNRLSGTGLYDGSGNYTNGSQYAYDAENQITSVNGTVLYRYNGRGERVEKIGQRLYWYGASGETLAESGPDGTIATEYIYFGSQRIAAQDEPNGPSGWGPAHYYFADNLGSSQVVTDAFGAIEMESQYFPYGIERSIIPWTPTSSQSSTDAAHYKFSGKERDSETGLDYFGARYFGSNLGRWMSPDWAGSASAVPYADFGNPQSLNLYSYVGNNPATYYDSVGHNRKKKLDPCKADPDHCVTVSAHADPVPTIASNSAGLMSAHGSPSLSLAARLGRRYGELHRSFDDWWDQKSCEWQIVNCRNVVAADPFFNPSGLPALVRVGRWMSEEEYKLMVDSGKVVESSLNGVTNVTVPPNPASYKDAASGSVFVEFDVPASALKAYSGSNGWAKIYGPSSIFGQKLGIEEMPEATNVEVTIP